MFKVGYSLGILLVTAAMVVWAPLKAVFEALHGGVLLIWDVWK